MTQTTDVAPTQARTAETGNPPIAYYDGACPLCRREIAFLEARTEDGALAFEDISKGSGPVAGDLTRDDAKRRMHVRKADGTIVSGARAFLVMWAAVPAARPFVRILSIPPFPTLLEGAYRVFLLARPTLQRLAGK
ncbi:MAG: DUF393 domain-containing protein [Pseudomonadota bacterium]